MIRNVAIFIDRDGVLNKKPAAHDYIKSFKEFYWNDNAKDLIREIKNKGFLVIVTSNQQGISLGKMSKRFVDELHKKMNKDLEKYGTKIDAFYYCYHHMDDMCNCRKPRPGMFILAAAEFEIDLKKSFMVGDSETDRIAADNAGCKGTIIIPSDKIDVKKIMNEIFGS